MSFNDFPKSIQDREQYFLEQIKNNNYSVNFTTVSSEHKNNFAYFRVFDDALKIDDIRINVSAQLEQQIADHMGCMLMTAKIADLRYMQATTVLQPHTRWDTTGGKLMSTNDWMKWHSDKIENDLNKINYKSGLVATVGKHWVIDDSLSSRKKNMPNQAINYGWHYKGHLSGVPADLPVSYKTMPGVKMIQSLGYHHSIVHVDYSQICVLVARECEVNGKAYDLKELLKLDDLSYLANSSGKTNVWRIPSVPELHQNEIFIPEI